MSGNAKFIMQKGREAGNLPKKIKPGPAGAGKAPDRKQHMAHTTTAPLKPAMKGQKVETQLARGPFKDRGQSLGKVNSGFKVK